MEQKTLISKKSLFTKCVDFLTRTFKMKDFICHSLVFKPPPRGYIFDWIYDKEREISYYGLYFIVTAGLKPMITQEENLHILPFKLDIPSGKPDMPDLLALIYIRNLDCSDNYCVIYSHGNASDISHSILYAKNIALLYKINVLVYDYRGYGISRGETSEKSMYDDLEYVLGFATLRLNHELNKIILWGFSLGSAPVVEIGSRYQNIGGIVLQAPIASLLIWTDKKATWDYSYSTTDIFCNINKIENIKSKIFIIHGKKDTIINPRHSYLLYQRFMQLRGEDNDQIWFVMAEEAGHNDLHSLLDSENEFSRRVSIFIDLIKYCNSNDDDLLLEEKNKQNDEDRLSFLEREMESLRLCLEGITDNFDSFRQE